MCFHQNSNWIEIADQEIPKYDFVDVLLLHFMSREKIEAAY
jgi:hypothetical protein